MYRYRWSQIAVYIDFVSRISPLPGRCSVWIFSSNCRYFGPSIFKIVRLTFSNTDVSAGIFISDKNPTYEKYNHGAHDFAQHLVIHPRKTLKSKTTPEGVAKILYAPLDEGSLNILFRKFNR